MNNILPVSLMNKYLDDKQIQVLTMRFEGKTFREIGKSVKLTAERVRQIEIRANIRLREKQRQANIFYD
jgi:DNA-directed RNA polymerase sigma subunit (sigma70/sigma32)